MPLELVVCGRGVVIGTNMVVVVEMVVVVVEVVSVLFDQIHFHDVLHGTSYTLA